MEIDLIHSIGAPGIPEDVSCSDCNDQSHSWQDDIECSQNQLGTGDDFNQ